MKNSIILIYLVFTGFISFNNCIVTQKGYQDNYIFQNFTDNCSYYDFSLILSNGELNHKLNHSGNIKWATAYINDFTNINKIIPYPISKTYPYRNMILINYNNFYHMDKFLTIFTQSDKTIQAEFIII